eukprot:1117399-Amphidinium_carterae.1
MGWLLGSSCQVAREASGHALGPHECNRGRASLQKLHTEEWSWALSFAVHASKPLRASTWNQVMLQSERCAKVPRFLALASFVGQSSGVSLRV